MKSRSEKSRRTCREYALQGLYQLDSLRDFRPEAIGDFLQHLVQYPVVEADLAEDDNACSKSLGGEGSQATEADRVIEVGEYCHTLLYGVVEQLSAVDAALTAASTNWGVARMTRVDRCILRLAAYELLFCPDVPPKVVINEAVEISRDFSGDEAYLFINGVLDRILKAR